MNKKITASILMVILFLIHLLRYNLWIINMSTDISLFDLLDGLCWILVSILLVLNQRSRFITSMYILLAFGGLNIMYNEFTLTATKYDPNNYIFLWLSIICVIGYNKIVSYLTKKNK